MGLSLYDVSVGTYQQILGAISGCLAKGAQHFRDTGSDPSSVLATRLYPDMLPFAFQLHSVTHHSLGALEGCRAGRFSPPPDLPDLDYAGWQARIEDASARIASVSPGDVEALLGTEVVFSLGGNEIPFVAEDFLLSFSLPNFYFHATTAYDILRMQGVPIGKRDFLGAMRIKR